MDGTPRFVSAPTGGGHVFEVGAAWRGAVLALQYGPCTADLSAAGPARLLVYRGGRFLKSVEVARR